MLVCDIGYNAISPFCQEVCVEVQQLLLYYKETNDESSINLRKLVIVLCLLVQVHLE